MKRIAMMMTAIVGTLAALFLANVAHADTGIRYRIDARGITVPMRSNFPRIERNVEVSWPSHTSVNAGLSEGERLDSLGRIVPSRTNSPRRPYAQVTVFEAQEERVGAAPYRPHGSSGWHQPFAPFHIAQDVSARDGKTGTRLGRPRHDGHE